MSEGRLEREMATRKEELADPGIDPNEARDRAEGMDVFEVPSVVGTVAEWFVNEGVKVRKGPLETPDGVKFELAPRRVLYVEDRTHNGEIYLRFESKGLAPLETRIDLTGGTEEEIYQQGEKFVRRLGNYGVQDHGDRGVKNVRRTRKETRDRQARLLGGTARARAQMGARNWAGDDEEEEAGRRRDDMLEDVMEEIQRDRGDEGGSL